MASCLGLYIESNLIKYAKVSKSNDAIKVEAFGLKFYDNIEVTIKQIIEETYSFKTPISINISDEIYDKFEIFSLLSKKDLEDAIKTEFENICYERDTNKNLFEQRYVFAASNTNNERVKVISIATPKTVIAQRKNQFTDYKISNMLPISVTIPNLIKKEKKTTSLIVNIEEKTIITKVNDNGVLDISTLSIGAKDIIEKIEKKENSYSKAYEICKNTTIYTDTDKDLQYEENDYLEDIMPTLFQIVSEVRKITEESFEKIDKVYITGTGAIVNNIDIYFQDYLKNIKCEILRPSFVSNNAKLNIKDYIEVNSAISIALQGIEKNNSINFTKEPTLDKVLTLLKSDFSFRNLKNNQKNNQNTYKVVDGILNKFSKQYNVTLFTISLMFILYFVGVIIINNQYNNKIEIAEVSIENTNTRIEKIQEYKQKFNSQISEYQALINKIEDINNANSEDKRHKNTIPNLLNNIMVVIPKNVQLTSIENTSDTHIIIKAVSSKYEQIAFFKTKLKTEEILKNVVSDTGTMQGGYLSVTIEGELP